MTGVLAPQPTARDRAAVLGLGVAVTYGALAQGGFHAGQARTMLLAVAGAAVARALTRRPAAPFVRPCGAAWLLLAVWVLADGWLHGDVHAALPAAALAACLAAALWTAHGLPAHSRAVLGTVLLTTAVAVAATGWLGVLLHREPLALVSSGLWRASSTITYANATAAFLTVAVLVAVAVLPARRPSALALVAVLLLGLVATLSRAGLMALLVGVAVLAAASPRRRDLLDWWPAPPAAVVAFAGLVPSLPAAAPPRPFLAVAGLAGGLAVVVACRRRPALAAGATLAAAALAAASAAWPTLVATRLTAASAERADLTRVAVAQLGRSPLIGVGPGRLDLAYVDHAGVAVRALYAHDEYLQLAAETGVVGLALAVAGLLVLAAAALRARSGSGAAALAVLAAFAVHSAFDFLWHVPALPLLVVLAVAVLVPETQEESP